ncbi:MAG: tripartite tricarboxylate transporter permease, partial [Thermoplasmata archaeon]
MHELGLIASIALSALAGTLLGFAAGLVPGLHMNNIAAFLTAYAGAALAAFGALEKITGGTADRILVCCFISAALIAHLFGEAMTSTYVGIPSEDVVSVLPAHRLAKAGLGPVAVRASADGCLVGMLIASA